MHVEIITPDKKLFEGMAQGIQVPGRAGSFEVLENHAPIISVLEKGKVRIRLPEGTSRFFEIEGGGIIEVLQNKVILLAESATEV
ncbi:MAG: ATP synthase F1 subunit epsilon [Cytophagales bacterium]|nr:ATP synthase F1 subunit epsilon [Bernardetiaceae bacterium]MDW8209882.1 ATP synthase F1 subunit epsilon [Cytophagales bacterium]